MIPYRPIHNLTGLVALRARRQQSAFDLDQAPRFVDVAAVVGLGLLVAVDLLLAWW